jgi:2-polyprenyl-3-methyl-5-hydroxy-6-metoxy-1,4-benzoquinol methylase
VKYINCPTCKSNESTEIVKDLIFTISKCRNCNLIYLKFYTKSTSEDCWEYDLKSGTIENYYLEQFDSKAPLYYNFIYKKNIVKSKVLDIGAGFGYFVNYLQKKGIEAHGIEHSKTAVDLAILKYNLRLINDSFPSKKVNDLYEIVTLFDVIEHINSPISFINEIKKIQPKNGRLIISVPNINSLTNRIILLIFRITLGKISKPMIMMTQLEYSSVHLSYYNIDTLNYTLKNAGYKHTKHTTISTINHRKIFEVAYKNKKLSVILASFYWVIQQIEALLNISDTLLVEYTKK